MASSGSGDPSAPLFEIRGLRFRYGPREILSGVDLEVRDGEVVGLLGPNGAGKTTTFGCAAGLLRPREGAVRLRGRTLDRLPLHRRARLGLGYLPQGHSVFRGLTVEENLRAVLEVRGMDHARGSAAPLLERFGLGGLAARKASTLSGGEQRRLEVARAVAGRPLVLLTDEPFTGVDPIAVQELRAILRDLASDGISTLLTDHNVHETLAACDRAYLLFEGRILAHGTPAELERDPVVRRCYLGEGWRSAP